MVVYNMPSATKEGQKGLDITGTDEKQGVHGKETRSIGALTHRIEYD